MILALLAAAILVPCQCLNAPEQLLAGLAAESYLRSV